MIHPLRMHYDKLLLALALAALAWSLEWVRRHQTELHRVHAPTSLPPPAVGYIPERSKASDTIEAEWSSPRAQSHGEGWLYEVFTPPVIHYNAADRTFALTPIKVDLEPSDEKPWSWSLLAVKPDAFRLQLAGYCGIPDDYLVVFMHPQSADTLLARVGHRFVKLELTFKSFEVRNVLAAENESGPVHEMAAVAVLFDERSNREVVLDSRGWRFTDSPIAVLRQPDGAGELREFREGDTFAEADVLCRIERVQLNPAEVVVSRTMPGLSVPELRVLRPVAPNSQTTSDSTTMPQIEAGRVAINSP